MREGGNPNEPTEKEARKESKKPSNKQEGGEGHKERGRGDTGGDHSIKRGVQRDPEIGGTEVPRKGRERAMENWEQKRK